MPKAPRTRSFLGLVDSNGAPGSLTAAPSPVPAPAWQRVVGAGMEQESDVYSFATSNRTLAGTYINKNFEIAGGYGGAEVEEGFDSFRFVQDKGIEHLWKDFVDIHNAEAAERLYGDMMRDEENNNILAAAGFGGTAARILGGVASATTLIPVGSSVRAISAGRQFLSTTGKITAVGTTSAALSEIPLQFSQPDRSFGESLAAIGGAAIGSALLGSVAGVIAAKKAKALTTALEIESAGFRGSDGNLAKVVHTPTPGETVDDITQEATARGLGAEAAVARMTPDDSIQYGGLWGLGKKVQDLFYWVDPMTGAAVGKAHSLRVLGGMLQETGQTIGNRKGLSSTPEGGGSVYTASRRHERKLSAAYEVHRDAYGAYRYGKVKIGQTGRSEISRAMGNTAHVSESEFNVLVGKAMRRGDMTEATGDAGLDAAINKSAKSYREMVFDPMLNEAISVGHMPPGITTKFAKSYLQREYNRQVIMDRKDDWYKLLKTHMENERARARKTLKNKGQFFTKAEVNKAARKAAAAAVKKFRDEWTGPRPPGEAQIKDVASKADRDFKARQDRLEHVAHVDTEGIEEAMESITQKLLGNANGRIDFKMIIDPTPRGAALERVLSIRDTFSTSGIKFEDFLESDIARVSSKHIRTMGADVELKRMFPDGLKPWYDQISREYDELDAVARADIKSGKLSEKKGARLRKGYQAERQRFLGVNNESGDIQSMIEQIQHLRGLPTNPNARWSRFLHQTKNLQLVTKLGQMTVAAIPDPMKIAMEMGFGRGFGDIIKEVLVHGTDGLKMTARDLKFGNVGLDVADSGSSRANMMGDLFNDGMTRHSKPEAVADHISNAFPTMVGMNHWNGFHKTWAGATVQKRMYQALKDMKSGKITEDELGRLGTSGIDTGKSTVSGYVNAAGDKIASTEQSLAEAVLEQWEKHGELFGTESNGRFVPHTDKWDIETSMQRRALKAFRDAVSSDVNRIIVTPGLDKPIWMSDELGSVVGQFKSFNFASFQRTIVAGLQHNDRAAASGLAGLIGAGMFTYYLREKLNGREPSSDARVWIAEGIDRSGAMAFLSDFNAFSEKASAGWVGLSALSGQQVSRYQSRGVLEQLFGPTAGSIVNAFEGGSGIARGDITDSTLNSLQRLTAYQNALGFSVISDALFDAIPRGKLPWYEPPAKGK